MKKTVFNPFYLKRKMNFTEDYLGNVQTKIKGLNSFLDEIRELKVSSMNI